MSHKKKIWKEPQVGISGQSAVLQFKTFLSKRKIDRWGIDRDKITGFYSFYKPHIPEAQGELGRLYEPFVQFEGEVVEVASLTANEENSFSISLLPQSHCTLSFELRTRNSNRLPQELQ